MTIFQPFPLLVGSRLHLSQTPFAEFFQFGIGGGEEGIILGNFGCDGFFLGDGGAEDGGGGGGAEDLVGGAESEIHCIVFLYVGLLFALK